MTYSPALYSIALAVFGAAAVLHLWCLRSDSLRRAASISGLAGLIVLTVAIVVHGIETGRLPFATVMESLTFVAWVLTAIYLFMQRGSRITALGAFSSVIAFVAVGVYVFLMPQDVSNAFLSEMLGNRWAAIHITSSLAAYASFFLAFGAALGYMLQEKMLKAKKITVLQRHLPSLDALDNLAYKMVALGFPMLTLGVITGAMWAQTAWGTYWDWDPKETWSLITWLVYAAYLHVRIVQGWRGKWANRLLVIGAASVLITYIGVTYFWAGNHSHSA